MNGGGGSMRVDAADVLAARRVLAGALSATPLVSHPLLTAQLGCEVVIKLENAHALGSFKVRGGLVLLASMTTAERARGIVSATRGNHGQSLAHAAREHGTRCTLFVPQGNSPDKNVAMRALGADVVVRGRNFDEAWRSAVRHGARTGARLVHPGQEPALVAGAGTIALELLDQVERPLDVVLAPVGVGSCVAGIAIAMAALSPRTRIIGVAAARAPAMARAFANGRFDAVAPGRTIADGLAVGVPVRHTLELMRSRVSEIVTVDEVELRAAIMTYARTIHQLAEGAGAAALAGAMALRTSLRGKHVAVVLSGGNITASALRRVLAA